MAAVEVRNGYKFYGRATDPNKKIVLDSLNMVVMNGSIYGLLGASGCGKTTLLSCIVGRRKLNGGTITVLGGHPGSRDSGVPGPRVGYMPQDIALLEEFSVVETIFYFGRIYGMSDQRIHERFAILSKLLELPDPTRIVGNMSGGQQRRVSFACALVHEPELLILDEPTVGLDPLLRERIWEYLIDTTRTTKLAVIITTHYIEEAKMAHRVGLMRNGILLAEDSPQTITSMFRCDSLEDAFLQLCLKHGESDEAGILNRVEQARLDYETPIDIEITPQSDEKKVPPTIDDFTPRRIPRRNMSFQELRGTGIKGAVKFTSPQRMKALLSKNILQIIRQPAGLAFCFLFPILQLTSFYIAIGANPKDLKIGIFNEEVTNYHECMNKSLVTAWAKEDESCSLHKLSCRFMSGITKDIAEKVYFETENDAYVAARKADVVGYIHIRKNFSDAVLQSLNDALGVTNQTFVQREISIRLDNSDQQITFFVERKLREVFANFSQAVMKDCSFSENLAGIPVHFEEPFYGSFNDEFTEFVAPGIIMTMVFFLAALGTSTTFITERLDGTWDRVLVAGITAVEVLFAHIITQIIVLFLQCAEMLYFSVFVFGNENRGDNLTIILLLVLLGFAGMLFGLLISIFCDSHTTASYVVTGAFYPMIILCGLLWPLEGMPINLRYFALTFPFTIPSISMRNILVKGWGITNFEVYNGFLVLVGWSIVFTVLCLLGLRIKK